MCHCPFSIWHPRDWCSPWLAGPGKAGGLRDINQPTQILIRLLTLRYISEYFSLSSSGSCVLSSKTGIIASNLLVFFLCLEYGQVFLCLEQKTRKRKGKQIETKFAKNKRSGSYFLSFGRSLEIGWSKISD